MKFSNKYDQQQADRLVKTLLKAKEQVETALIYLNANQRPMEEIFNARLVQEHIDIALEHLGVTEAT